MTIICASPSAVAKSCLPRRWHAAQGDHLTGTADGIAVLPRGSQGLPAGASVDVRLYRNPADLEHTIFAIGSHDMTLDLLAQYLAKCNRRLASANVGSQGGLVALRRGEAHLAGLTPA